MPKELFSWSHLLQLGIEEHVVTGGTRARAGEIYVVPASVVERLRDILQPLGFDLNREVRAEAFTDNHDAFLFEQ